MGRLDVRRGGVKVELELEVHVKDELPYLVKLTPFLTWLDGQGEKLVGTNLDVRVYGGRPSWVTIVGPLPRTSGEESSARQDPQSNGSHVGTALS